MPCQTYPGLIFYQVSGHPWAQSFWCIKLSRGHLLSTWHRDALLYSYSVSKQRQWGYIFAKHVKTILPTTENAAIPLIEEEVNFLLFLYEIMFW